MARTTVLKNSIKTSQREPIPGRENAMKRNSAGGYSFKVGPMEQVRRFLILGTEGGSYYASESKLTKENAKNLLKAINADGEAVVREIVEISQAGRAPKNDQALFALAMAAGLGNEATRKAALDALPLVARTGTHLFMFADFVQEFRGWGPSLRKSVAGWYDNKTEDQLAYQLVKYRQREGWTHRDLLRLAHPVGHPDLYNWVSGRKAKGLPQIIKGYQKAQKAESASEIVSLIEKYDLPREALPTQFLNETVVWAALLEKMPLTAMIRNLGNMSKVGLLVPMSDASKLVVSKLQDTEYLQKSRIHPLNVLSAKLTYGSGHGYRGSGTWPVVPQVIDALEDAFYGSFKNIEPSGKNVMLGIDVSGSMTGGQVGGVPGLTPNMAAAAMAMVTARTEPNYFIGGFSHTFVDLGITANHRLEEAMRKCQRSFGGTDCAIPMQYARQHKIPVDAFVIYTDAETWYGEEHGATALKKYRKGSGIPAKMVNVGLVANRFSIADPDDAGMMDVVGFDSAAPALIGDFVADRI